jgi:hypothetical protein
VTGEFESFQQFNECLSIGYFENTKIGVSTVKEMLLQALADFI